MSHEVEDRCQSEARPEQQVPDMAPMFGFEISDLSSAIDHLRGACGKLQDSVNGVNGELEQANRQLSEAVKKQRETSAYLETILAAIPSGVIVVDREGRIAGFNGAAEAITGFSADEVKGTIYSRTIGSGAPQKQTPLYTLATGSAIDQEEKSLMTRSGTRVPVSFSTSLMIDGDNRIVGAIEVLTDMRKVKLLEEEISRTRTLATIGEIAAVVAHEIRNPLGGIKGFAGLLQRDLAGNPDKIALVQKIIEGIGALEGIVSDLLEAGKPVTLKLEQTDLAHEVRRLVDMFDMAAKGDGKQIKFQVLCEEMPFYCRIDRGRLAQAIANLLRNATDAVGDAGTITVRIYAKDSGLADSAAPAKPLRDYLCIEVADTGPGISDELLDKIFAPFFTTKRDGTGLGLATVRRIAALHGGEVGYSKGNPQGSKFTLEIPRR